MEELLKITKESKTVGVLGMVGAAFLVVGGVWWYQGQNKVEVEVISEGVEGVVEVRKIYIDVAGAVVKPGVYEASSEARLKDVLAVAGGLSDKADRDYVGKRINLAVKVSDGMKIYIPSVGEQASEGQSGQILGVVGSGVNINTASTGELTKLSGVGEVRAKAIVEGRPYTKIEELVEKKILPSSVFEKVREQISVF